MKFKDILYAFASLSFAVVIGAAAYEHVAVVPRWTATPPVSLTMFQGEYGLNAGAFWQSIHPVTLVLLLVTLAVHWKTDRKINLIVTIGSYFAILAITAVYFVPELLSIIHTPVTEAMDPLLKSRAEKWETLSLVRLFTLVGLAISLFTGLTKPEQEKSRKKNRKEEPVLA